MGRVLRLDHPLLNATPRTLLKETVLLARANVSGALAGPLVRRRAVLGAWRSGRGRWRYRRAVLGAWRSGRGRWRYRRAWLWRGGGLGVMAGGRGWPGQPLARAPNSLA